MSKELELWQFAYARLKKDECIMLLVVAESSGSSPGRQGYKMAIAANGELFGSIGGGVMEVQLVEQAKSNVRSPKSKVVEQVHQENAPNASGMICSGRQTVIVKQLAEGDLDSVNAIVDCLEHGRSTAFEISDSKFQVTETTRDNSPFFFSKTAETQFLYQERVGYKHNLFIIGGGHCALALSEVMSRLGFCISIFDDRPDLNTLEKNRFANRITLLDSYEEIADFVPSGDDSYVVVMTIGYKFDEIVIRRLFDRDFRYFGVLGSRAKIKTLLKVLEQDGFDKDRLARIRTPVGLAINSRTPEEIAISIAAEIIAVKNS